MDFLRKPEPATSTVPPIPPEAAAVIAKEFEENAQLLAQLTEALADLEVLANEVLREDKRSKRKKKKKQRKSSKGSGNQRPPKEGGVIGKAIKAELDNRREEVVRRVLGKQPEDDDYLYDTSAEGEENVPAVSRPVRRPSRGERYRNDRREARPAGN